MQRVIDIAEDGKLHLCYSRMHTRSINRVNVKEILSYTADTFFVTIIERDT